MAAQYIFQMQGLTKAYPGGKKVFENIWLSFYPDAKIGVVGVNGSGKSTLLKIMAGIDKEFSGEAKPPTASRWATWSRSRTSTRAQRLGQRHRLVRREEAVRPVQRRRRQAGRGLLRRADGGDDRAPGEDRRRRPLGHRLQDRDGHGRPALPAGRLPRRPTSPAASGGAWPWPGCCCPSPTCCCWTSRPTTWTPKSVAWLQHHLENFPGCVILVTHDRYFLDQVTKWTLELDRGKGIPYEGNYSGLAGAEGQARPPGAVRERGRASAPWRASWSGCARRPSARRSKSKARLAAYDEMVNQQEREKQTFATIQIPPGPAPGQCGDRGRGPGEGVRRQAPVQGPRRSSCRPTASSA